MKKGIILYQSKYGATYKYVRWLQEMTGFDCVETPKAALEQVLQYERWCFAAGFMPPE